MIRRMIKDLVSPNTLYYPGCLTKYVLKDLMNNYEKLLNKIGVNFIKLENIEHCCGSPAKNAGYKKDYEELVEHNRNVFKEHGIKRIITNCPSCHKILSNSYPDFEIKHVLELIYEKRKKLKNKLDEKVSYHKPCHLILEKEPLKLLEACGYEVINMNNMCCGAGGGLKTNNPKLANKIAKMKLKSAEDKIITSCPLCYAHLKENTSKEVLEISEVLLECL